MTWSFVSIGSVGSAFNATMTPGAPAGSQSNDILALFCWSQPGRGSLADLTSLGYTRITLNTSLIDVAIYASLATGNDVMPTFQFGSDWQGCFCAAYRGGQLVLDRTGIERGTNLTNGVQFGSYNAPPDDGTLILGVGVRSPGSANGVTFGSSNPYTTRGVYTIDGRPHAIAVDLIQTTASPGNLVTVSSSPADSTALQSYTELAFLKLPTLAPPTSAGVFCTP